MGRKFISIIEKKERFIICTLLIGVFLAGIGYSVFIGENFRFPDEKDYYLLGGNLKDLRGYSLDGITSTACRPPGYPFIIASIMFLSKSLILIRIINYLAFCLSIFMVYLMVKKFSTSFFGLLSAFLCLCYPVFFYTASVLCPQIIASMLFLLILFLSLKEEKMSSLKGITVGFCLLF